MNGALEEAQSRWHGWRVHAGNVQKGAQKDPVGTWCKMMDEARRAMLLVRWDKGYGGQAISDSGGD